MNRLIGLVQIAVFAALISGCAVGTASNPDQSSPQRTYATDRARDAQGGGGGGGGGY